MDINTVTVLGTGTKVIQGKTITNNVILGIGAVVTKDVDESGIYVGAPIRKVK